jgi:hypothetical protein
MISDLDAVLLREEAEEGWKQDVGAAEMVRHERYEPAEPVLCSVFWLCSQKSHVQL